MNKLHENVIIYILWALEFKKTEYVLKFKTWLNKANVGHDEYEQKENHH